MDDLSQCHRFAVREVTNAIRIIDNERGSKAADIYYILDQLHGKVKRPVIKQVLRSAVHKGVLSSQRGYYKLSNRKYSVKKSNQIKSRTCVSTVTLPYTSHAHSDGSSFFPVRNFECNFVNKAKSTNACLVKTPYRYNEVDGPQSCHCSSSDDEMSCLSSSGECCCCGERTYSRDKVGGKKKPDRIQRKSKIPHHQVKKNSYNNSSRKSVNKRNSPKNTVSKSDKKAKGKSANKNKVGDKNNNQTKETIQVGESSKSPTNKGSKTEPESNKSSVGQGQNAETPKENQENPPNNRDYMGMYANNIVDGDNLFYY